MFFLCFQESLLIFAAQSEEDSEKIAEDFLHSHIDVDAFLDSYLEKRIVSNDHAWIDNCLGHVQLDHLCGMKKLFLFMYTKYMHVGRLGTIIKDF